MLARARVVATLQEALDGMAHVCATAMTPRDFGPPTRAPRAHFNDLLTQAAELGVAADRPGEAAALAG